METLNLNLIPTGANPVAHVSQYDEGRVIRFNLFEGSAVYTLDGTETIECDVKKPDGNIVTVAVTNTSDSYVEIDTTLQMCACAGESLAELHITKGAQELGTLNFILAVERSPLEGGIESESDLHNLQEQIGEAVAEQYAAEDVVFDAAPVAGHGTGFAVTSEGVKNYVEGEIAALTIPEELDDLQDVELTSPTAGQILEYDDNDGKWKNVSNPASTTNFGAPYDESATYNVPSLVIENNLLYKLNEGEVDVTGPFDPTKWTQTSLAELTAEDFPLSSTDPTPTSEAIGDLSQLTTTDKSSLVGAVNEVNGKVSNILTNISALSNLSTKVSVGGNTSKTVTVTGDSSGRVGYVVFGQAAQGNLSPIFYLIGGYVTASRCSVTNISGKTGVTVDATSTTDLKFVFANATSVPVDLFFYPLFENTFTAS